MIQRFGATPPRRYSSLVHAAIADEHFLPLKQFTGQSGYAIQTMYCCRFQSQTHYQQEQRSN
jgi:hypothetical protein